MMLIIDCIMHILLKFSLSLSLCIIYYYLIFLFIFLIFMHYSNSFLFNKSTISRVPLVILFFFINFVEYVLCILSFHFIHSKLNRSNFKSHHSIFFLALLYRYKSVTLDRIFRIIL